MLLAIELKLAAIPLLLVVSIVAAENGRFTTAGSPESGGGYAFTVTNESNVLLTGFTVAVERHSFGSSTVHHMKFYYDSLLNHQPALKQGQSYTWHLGFDAREVPPLTVAVDAAIYANGFAAGDTQAIKSLWSRRQWLAVAYQEVFHQIDASVPDINNRAEAVRILTQIKDERLPPATPRDERAGVTGAYENVIANIRDSTAPPTQVLEGLRAEANQIIKAIHDQVAPTQVSQ